MTTLQNFAFYECIGLTSTLNLPDGLKTIGKSAFAFCSGFNGSMVLPKELTAIDDRAFLECTGLTGTLNLPASLTKIGYEAFYNCSGFSGSSILPEEVTMINKSTFYNCTGLTGLVLGNKIVSIDERGFEGCSNISGTVVFPLSLEGLGRNAFEGCKKVDAFRFTQTTPIPLEFLMFPYDATVEVPAWTVYSYKHKWAAGSYNIVGY